MDAGSRESHDFYSVSKLIKMVLESERNILSQRYFENFFMTKAGTFINQRL